MSNETSKNKAKAAEAAADRTVSVEWRDLEPFEVPMYHDAWPLEAVLAAEEGNRATMLRHLLPAQTYREFASKPRKGADAFDLSDAIGRAIGLANAGESPTSTS